jgi:hypothetical protein
LPSSILVCTSAPGRNCHQKTTRMRPALRHPRVLTSGSDALFLKTYRGWGVQLLRLLRPRAPGFCPLATRARAAWRRDHPPNDVSNTLISLDVH